MFKIILAMALFGCIPVAAQPAQRTVESTSFLYQHIPSKDFFPSKAPRLTVVLNKKILYAFIASPSAESAQKITELKSFFTLLEEEIKTIRETAAPANSEVCIEFIFSGETGPHNFLVLFKFSSVEKKVCVSTVLYGLDVVAPLAFSNLLKSLFPTHQALSKVNALSTSQMWGRGIAGVGGVFCGIGILAKSLKRTASSDVDDDSDDDIAFLVDLNNRVVALDSMSLQEQLVFWKGLSDAERVLLLDGQGISFEQLLRRLERKVRRAQRAKKKDSGLLGFPEDENNAFKYMKDIRFGLKEKNDAWCWFGNQEIHLEPPLVNSRSFGADLPGSVDFYFMGLDEKCEKTNGIFLRVISWEEAQTILHSNELSLKNTIQEVEQEDSLGKAFKIRYVNRHLVIFKNPDTRAWFLCGGILNEEGRNDRSFDSLENLFLSLQDELEKLACLSTCHEV